MKKKILIGCGFALLMFGLASCDNESNENLEPKIGDEVEPNNNGGNNTKNVVKKYDTTPTIFLAGDSTVKTYIDDQYIAGWGQYLDLYLPSSIEVHNAAQGGRSSRSFINEGRLYDTKEANFKYSFTENNGKTIESEIEEGDFLFIQFGHNDDDTKKYEDLTYMYQRFVPLGTPSNGIYPTIAPAKTSTSVLPSDMPVATKTEVSKYGANYYAYDETGKNGTYKGYLKEYIDFAREKGATPVLVTPVSRVKFNSSGEIIGGKGLHGDNFAYVEAMKQLANEEDCLLIDLFSYSKNLLEVATPAYSNFLMALKPNGLTGQWPTGYDRAYNNADSGYTGIEATHYNKYGAFLEAAYIASQIKTISDTHNDGKEYFSFKDNVLTTPESYVNPSNLITKSKANELESTIDLVNVTDPNRQYPSNSELLKKLALIPEVSNITTANYLDVKKIAEDAEYLYFELNVDDRKIEYKTKIDNALNKIQEIIVSLRPVATDTYSIDFSNISSLDSLSSPFKINDTEGKLSINEGKLKFGGNGTKDNKNLAVTLSGKGKVLFTFKGSISASEKSASLGVSDGTEEKIVILEGNVKSYEIEFEIDGDKTFYLYRAAGSSTGVLCASLVAEYFAE